MNKNNTPIPIPSGVQCPPNGFRVTYSLTRGGDGQDKTIEYGTATSTILTGLKKWTKYYIKVTVRNDRGFGPFSAEKEIRTAEEAPDAAPDNFRVDVTSSTAVSLTWSLPSVEKRNGVIRGFKIAHCKISDCSSFSTIPITDGSIRTYNKGGLDMYTEYDFKILAYTVADGPYTSIITTRTHEGPPTKPVNVMHQLIQPSESTGPHDKLTWNPPSEPNGIITGYKVSFGIKGSDKVEKTLDKNTFSLSFPVCGEKTYDFEIWASNSKEEGQKASGNVQVPSYAPGQAKNLTSSKHNTTTYSLSWNPLPGTNGPIITYEVQQVLAKDSTKIMANVSCSAVACRGTGNHLCRKILYTLPQCSQYNVKVRGYTNKGPGSFSQPVVIVTSAPGPPRGLVLLDSDKDTATLQWQPPQTLVDPVTKYTVHFSGKKDYQCICKGFSPSGKKETPSTKATITGLHPATSYTFTVIATTICGDGGGSNAVYIKTKTGAAPAPVVSYTVNISGTSANLTLWTTSSINGIVRGYQVIVNKVDGAKRKRRSIDDGKLTDYNTAKTLDLPYYIAGEILIKDPLKTPQEKIYFILGDGKMYGNYTNAELENGTQYEVYQRALTKSQEDPKIFVYGKRVLIAYGKTSAGQSSPNRPKPPTNEGSPVGAIVGSVFGVLIIIAIAVTAIIVFKRRKSKRPKQGKEGRVNKDYTDESQEMQANFSPSREEPTYAEPDIPPQGVPNRSMGNYENQRVNVHVYAQLPELPNLQSNSQGSMGQYAKLHRQVPAKTFSRYLNEKKAKANFLQNEFKDLSDGLSHSCDSATMPRNKAKNRYPNIVPYNHSRVILQETSNGSDYINASYINGFDRSTKAYIAAQGPTSTTSKDFWQMIWQEKITTIVMVTEEKGKQITQYWPNNHETYGKLYVSFHRAVVCADYIVQMFTLSKDGEEGFHNVYHFRYTSWPDKGVPEHATSVLEFRRKVRSQYASNRNNAPLLVHCNNGVGPTGVFITIDAMLERIDRVQTVDIFNFVEMMRNNRPSMIQTIEQYQFCFNAVQVYLDSFKDYVNCSDV